VRPGSDALCEDLIGARSPNPAVQEPRTPSGAWRLSAASLALRPKVLFRVEAMQAVRHMVSEPDARDGPLAEVRRVQHLHGAERASVETRMRAWVAPQVQCLLAMLPRRDPGRRASLTWTRQVEPTSFNE